MVDPDRLLDFRLAQIAKSYSTFRPGGHTPNTSEITAESVHCTTLRVPTYGYNEPYDVTLTLPVSNTAMSASTSLLSTTSSESDLSMNSSTATIEPLPWTWTCHRCRRSYRLGVTSRCLDCGHRMCAGRYTQMLNEEHELVYTEHVRGCEAFFDFIAWHAILEDQEAIRCLERGMRPLEPNGSPARDCWTQCFHPQMCMEPTIEVNHGLDDVDMSSPPDAVIETEDGALYSSVGEHTDDGDVMLN